MGGCHQQGRGPEELGWAAARLLAESLAAAGEGKDRAGRCGRRPALSLSPTLATSRMVPISH